MDTGNYMQNQMSDREEKICISACSEDTIHSGNCDCVKRFEDNIFSNEPITKNEKLKEAIQKAKPNMDKIESVDDFVNEIKGNLTKEEKLKEVESRIRKAIPSLMELSEGCLIRKKENSMIGKILESSNKELVSCFWENNEFEFIFKEEIEIIGKPITLNHVLEWFKNLKIKTIHFEVSDEGAFFYQQDYPIHIDLLKPLSDQSEELINFLYELK